MKTCLTIPDDNNQMTKLCQQVLITYIYVHA